MSTPPHDESASNPQSYSVAKDNSPTPSEVITAFKNWLLRRSETPREKSKWTDIALVILTFLVAVAAFVSACIFQGQLTEARRATNLTSESFRIDERAWVEIEPIKPTLFSPRADKIGAAFTYEIYLKNVGKTPARDIEFRSTPLTQGSITPKLSDC